jgi:hypothetical protein
MGIFIDWTLRAEGTDEEVREKLERVRQRCLDLPLRRVGEIITVDPAFCGVPIAMYERQGGVLPPAVEERYRPVNADVERRMQSYYAAPIVGPEQLSGRDQRRFYFPALVLISRGEHWDLSSPQPRKGTGTQC